MKHLCIVLATLLAIATSTRKLEIVQLANSGTLLSATTDWVDWGAVTPQGLNYQCKAFGDGTAGYGGAWLRFSDGGVQNFNAWIAVDDMVTFRFSQYNYAVANDGCSVMTSGWSSLPEGYYYVDVFMSKNGYNTYSQAAGKKSASGQYYLTVHLTNQYAQDSTYSRDTMVCSKGQPVLFLTLLSLAALLLGC